MEFGDIFKVMEEEEPKEDLKEKTARYESKNIGIYLPDRTTVMERIMEEEFPTKRYSTPAEKRMHKLKLEVEELLYKGTLQYPEAEDDWLGDLKEFRGRKIDD